MKNKTSKIVTYCTIAITISAFHLSCSLPNSNTKTIQEQEYKIDIGNGKKGGSLLLNIDSLNFNLKLNTDGVPGRKISDVKSYQVYLVKSSNGAGYPNNGDPLGNDKVAGPININVGTAPKHNIRLLNVPGSTYSYGTGDYFYIAIRAFNGLNGTGQDLIKVNNGSGTAWTGTTAGTPNVAISTGAGIQVLHNTYQVSSVTPFSITANLLSATGAGLDTIINVNTGSAGALTPASTNKSNTVISTVAGISMASGIPGSNGRLNEPEDVVIDSAGMVYVADQKESRIIKYDPATGLVHNVAGTSSPCNGYSDPLCNIGGIATNAAIKEPKALAVDSAGNVYLADIYPRVLKVDKLSGIITVFAGNGTSGSLGDGGQATAAEVMSSLDGLAVDTAGNVYLAHGDRVRKIDTSGIITTIAGGGGVPPTTTPSAATNALLNGVVSVVVDSAGTIYLAEAGNRKVHKISGGNISLLVNNSGATCTATGAAASCGENGQSTAATLNRPYALALDSTQSFLYIWDAGNNKAKKVNLSTGVLTRVAGRGNLGFNYGAMAITTMQFRGTDGFFFGGGIAVDSSNKVYISDRFNSRLRKVDPSVPRVDPVIQYFTCSPIDSCGAKPDPSFGLTQTDYFGDINGIATKTILNNPTQLLVDKDGNIIFSDRGALKIKKLDKATNVITVIAGSGSLCSPSTATCGDGVIATDASVAFNTPHGIGIDNKGNIYVTDRSDHRIRKIDVNTNIITTVAGTGDICPLTTNPCGDGGQATAAQFNLPTAIAFDSNNDMYIADRDNNRVRKIDHLSNIITTVAGTGAASFLDNVQATSAGINQPYAIAFDQNDNMYIADRTNRRVRKVTRTTQVITTVAGTGVTCTATGGAGPFCGDGGQATDAQFNEPVNIVVDFAGNIYVLDKISRMVRKIESSTGIISTLVGDGIQGYSGDGGPASLARIRDPYGMAIDNNGYIYIGDSGNTVIRMIK